MARPREFRRDKVLKNAISVFWKQGYTDTSISDLVQATGLLRGSLYAAFGNKRGLFIEAIETYFRHLEDETFKVFESEKPALERIREFFKEVIEESKKDLENKGCLLVNSILELSSEDDEINSRITEMFRTLENHFRNTLSQAVKEGTLPNDYQNEIVAKFFVSSLYGLRVFNKTKSTLQERNEVLNAILSILEHRVIF